MLLNLLLETSAGSGDQTASGSGNGWIIWVVFAVMIVVMILLTVLPNKKRQKEYNQMLSNLRVGTKIMTIGRMVGTITKLYDDGTLEVDVGTPGNPVIITITREAIGSNLTAQEEAKAQAEKAKADKKAEPVKAVEETPTQDENVVATSEETIGEQTEEAFVLDEAKTEETVSEEKPSKKKKEEDDAI